MTTLQHGPQHHHTHRSSATGRSVYQGMLCLLGVALLSGCVSSGKYEAEKARALNFQRLLAQEEKLADDLESKLEEAQDQVATLEKQNRDATVELEALRSGTSPQNDAAPGDAPAPSRDRGTSQEDELLSDQSLAEFGLDDLSFDEADFADIGGQTSETTGAVRAPTTSAVREPTYHTVVQGETLYRISRKYGVTVRQLKLWNRLSTNNILIGQRIIVSQP